MPITQNNPNNPQSPFYDEDGNSMNPIAKIHFIRQRLYNNDRSCNPDDDSGDSEDDDCATTKWEDWTPCSVPCGLGQKTRMRHYLKPRKAQDCYVPLVQHQTCQGNTMNIKCMNYLYDIDINYLQVKLNIAIIEDHKILKAKKSLNKRRILTKKGKKFLLKTKTIPKARTLKRKVLTKKFTRKTNLKKTKLEKKNLKSRNL